MITRREFLNKLVWTVAAAAVAPKVFAGPKTLQNDCKFISFTPAPLEDVDDSWWSWRELIIQIHRDGHQVRNFSLAAADGGYRRIRMTVMNVWDGKEHVWTWDQPWSRDAHYDANIHKDFAACSDCGALTMTPHQKNCKHSTALAHKLGPELNGFKTETDLITAPTKSHRGPWVS